MDLSPFSFSQIIRRVNHWRAGLGHAADVERRDQRMVNRWVDGQRLENLYEHTMELYRRTCQPRRRERIVKNQHGESRSESIDHSPGNLQCLKFAGHLLEMRYQFDQEAPTATGTLAEVDEYTLFRRLVDMRLWAEQRGDVPASKVPEYEVRRLLAQLLGRDKPRQSQPTRAAEEPEASEALAESPAEAINAPDPINNISAATVSNEPAATADEAVLNDCPAEACDEPVALPALATEPTGEANNSHFFASAAPLDIGPPAADIDCPDEPCMAGATHEVDMPCF